MVVSLLVVGFNYWGEELFSWREESTEEEQGVSRRLGRRL